MAILFKKDPVYAVAIQDANLTTAERTFPVGRHCPSLGQPLQGPDFNFFKPELPVQPLVQYDIALYSVGHVAKNGGTKALSKTPPSMISGRDKEHTMLIGDSGGYQIATGALGQHYDAKAMYQWLADHTDIAMNIDIPPWMIGTKKGMAGSRANYTFHDCLKETISNLRILRDNQYFGHKWLIVMQGEKYREAHVWREAILNELYYVDANGKPVLDDDGNRKPYIPAGFSFAGSLKSDLFRLIHDFLRFKHLGLLHDETWIHFLGVSQLKMTAFMTVFQDVMRNVWGLKNVTLSCDTAAAAKSAGITESFYTGFEITPNKIGFNYHQFPNYHSIAGVMLPLPGITTRVSQRFVQNDLLRHSTSTGTSAYDAFSYALLINHCLDVMQQGFREIIPVIRRSNPALRSVIPAEMIAAKDIVNDTFAMAQMVDADAALAGLDYGKMLALLNPYGNAKTKRKFGWLNFTSVTAYLAHRRYRPKGKMRLRK